MRKNHCFAGLAAPIFLLFLTLAATGQDTFPKLLDYPVDLPEEVPYPEDPHGISGTLTLTAATDYEGEVATGEAYVVRSGDGTHDGLRCPVVIVEGFDRTNGRNWPELRNDLMADDFGLRMLRAGRDLVLLNFGDGTTHIQANGHVLTKLLEYVNANRHDADEPLAVIGFSMGGLVSRYSLAWCETNGIDHDVDVFVSFDSPQEGANIPLGGQEALAWLNDPAQADLFDSLGTDEQAALNALHESYTCPAAQQMLVCYRPGARARALVGPHPARIALESEFEALGDYPTASRKVAIANGSGHGTDLFHDAAAPELHGAGLLLGTLSEIIPRTVVVTLDVYAVSTTEATVFEADIDWDPLLNFVGKVDTHEVFRARTSHAFDAAPGAWSSDLSSTDGLTVPAGREKQCFIPTVSALGLPIDRLFEDLSQDANLVAGSPFDELSYAVTNEGHVDLNTRTMGVLVRNLLGNLDLDGDGLSDQAEYDAGTWGWTVDTDEDGMDDAWEVRWQLDPLVDDADGDADFDGATNLEEYLAGTNPRTPESLIWNDTVARLHTIGRAIQDYQAAQRGALPDNLAQLVTEGYLATDVLLSPHDPTVGSDPHPYDGEESDAAYDANCSFFYLFSNAAHPAGGTWHDVSDAQHDGTLPDASFPLVQCFYGAPAPAEDDVGAATALNLAYDLTTVFATQGDWEAEPPPGAGPVLRGSGDIACPLGGTVMFPLWSPWTDQPNTLGLVILPLRRAGQVLLDGRFLEVRLDDIDPMPFDVAVQLKQGETVLDTQVYRVRPARRSLPIGLSAGWNLVGFALARTDNPVEFIFARRGERAAVGSAVFWDAPGITYCFDRPSYALVPGLWLYADTAGEVVADAVQFAAAEHELPAGWNLVGVTADVPLAACASLDACFAWNPATLRYEVITAGRGTLEAGYGYWLDLSTPCTFNPDTGALTPVAP